MQFYPCYFVVLGEYTVCPVSTRNGAGSVPIGSERSRCSSRSGNLLPGIRFAASGQDTAVSAQIAERIGKGSMAG